MQPLACNFPNLTHNDSSTTAISSPTNIRKILNMLEPVSLVWQDPTGNQLQLFKRLNRLFLVVLNSQDQLKIITQEKIHNTLNPAESEQALLHRLERIGLRKWDIVYRPESGHAYIWPTMEAAGGEDVKHSSIDASKTISGKSKITISDKEIYQAGNHLNKHGRDMGYSSKKEYHNAAKDFANKHQTNPQAKILEGRSNRNPDIITRAITYGGRTAIVCTKTGQLINFYKEGPNSAWKGDTIRVVREGNPKVIITDNAVQQAAQRVFKQGKPPGDPGSGGFRQLLNQTRLVDSYNSSNPGNPMLKYAQGAKDIGGVACVPEYIEGLFDTEDSLFENEHIFFMPKFGNGEIPFSDDELQQIIRELAIGIYTKGTLPFFSLHFNKDGDLYPVIHPAYANTLVGKVISWLDYIMKGYLNGGVFSEKFVKDWVAHNKNNANCWNELIDFKEYCKQHLEGSDQLYLSLQELMSAARAATDKPNSLKNAGDYNNSFRILAKQKTIQKSDGVFAIDWDFDVEYTIEPTASCQEALDRITAKTQQKPEYHQTMILMYDRMKKLVHDHMSKLPLCQKYFSMLGMISFLSSYFSTLKQHGKVPDLNAFKCKTNEKCPSLFPNLPIGDYRTETVEVSITDLLRPLFENDLTKLKHYFENVATDEEVNQLKARLLQSYRREIIKKYSYLERSHDLDNSLSRNTVEGILNKLRDDFNKVTWTVDLFCKNFEDNYADKGLRFPLKNYVVSLTEEYEQNERRIRRSYVGGCGLIMKPQKIETISQQYNPNTMWSAVRGREEERWVTIKNDSGKTIGAAFRLNFMDTPIHSLNDFFWLESTLVYDEKDEDFEETFRELTTRTQASYQSVAWKYNVQLKDKSGRNMIHRTAAIGNAEATQFLIDSHVSLNEPDSLGFYPVHYAACNGELGTFHLVRTNSNMNAKSASGITPMMCAIFYDQVDIVETLLEFGAKTNVQTNSGYTTLHCALHAGNREIILAILLKAKDISETINTATQEGITQLMLACELGSPEIVEILLKKGANALVEAKDGSTALSFATESESIAICQLIIKNSRLNKKSIEAAIKSENPEILKILMSNRAFFEYTNSSNYNPLLIAIQESCLKSAHQILEGMPKEHILSSGTHSYESAMDLALQFGFFDLAEAIYSKQSGTDDKALLRKLVKFGYSHFLRNVLSKSAISPNEYQILAEIALESGHHLVVTQLLSTHIQLESIKWANGERAEHHLAKSDGVFLLKKLSTKKNLLDKECGLQGKSLAYLAAEYSSWNVLRFLMELMMRQKKPLEHQFNDRHLLYGVLQSGELTGLKLVIEITKDAGLIDAQLDDNKTRPVHLACKTASTELLNFLIEKGATLNAVDGEGRNALFYAVRSECKQTVKILLKASKDLITSDVIYQASLAHNPKLLAILIEHGANLNRPNLAGDTAVMLAVSNCNQDGFVRLVNSGVSLTCCNKRGATPLSLSVETDQPLMTEMLVARVSDSSQLEQAMSIALSRSHLNCARALYQKVKPAKFPEPIPAIILEQLQHVFKSGNWMLFAKLMQIVPIDMYFVGKTIQGHQYQGTILHHALKTLSDPSEIQKLFRLAERQKGFNPNQKDSLGNTYGHYLVINEIDLATFPTINWKARGLQGLTFVHLAALTASPSYLENLLQNCLGDLINSVDDSGMTPLIAAIEAGKQENVECLIRMGADVNLATHQMITPLLHAVNHDRSAIVRHLLDRGADINRKGTSYRLSPVAMALTAKKPGIALLLAINNASLKSKDAKGNHLTHIASAMGYIPFLKILAYRNMPLDELNDIGMQPIHVAAYEKQLGAIRFLHQLKIPLDTPITKEGKSLTVGDTPLLFSARRGDYEGTKWLLDNHANPEVINQDKYGVLCSAAIGRNTKIYQLFEGYKLNDNLEQVHRTITAAIQVDDLEFLQVLYSRVFIDTEVQEGMTGLAVASMFGSLNATRFFLSQGANPLSTIYSEISPLEHSAGNKNAEQFKLMLNYCNTKDIDLKATNSKRQNLVHVSAKAGRVKHLQLMIAQSIPLDEQDYLGFTPLHYAAQAGLREVCSLLVCCGASYDKKSFVNEKTPLQMVGSQNRDLSNDFDRFKDLKSKATRGESLLQLAVRCGNRKAVLALAQNGPVNEVDQLGNTPLHEAVRQQNNDLIKLLVRNDARIDSLNSHQHSPLWIACFEIRNHTIVRLLVDLGALAQEVIKELKQSNLREKAALLKELQR